jgi:hypothetical protein
MNSRPWSGLVWIAIPDEEAPVEAPHFLNERDLHVQPRRGDRVADGASELEDDRLLAFVDLEVQGARREEKDPGDEQDRQDGEQGFRHGFTPAAGLGFESNDSQGIIAFWSASTM